jgi:hypothetical protein
VLDCAARRTAVVWRFKLVLDSVFALEAECAVVEHGEAVTKTTRVLVGVNRG